MGTDRTTYIAAHLELLPEVMNKISTLRMCLPMFLKLTTICDVSHVISSTRPSSPLFFPTREEGLGTRLAAPQVMDLQQLNTDQVAFFSENRVIIATDRI